MSDDCKALALELRRKGLTLDECLDALTPLWKVSRATLHRFYQSHSLGNLRKPKEDSKHFKDYEPGFLHIDTTYLPRMEGLQRFAYVAIDRATRLVYIEVHDQRNASNAVAFLKACKEFFPFRIHRLMTDNGAEFTNHFFNRWASSKRKQHPFEQLCDALGISHRYTRPYTPKTNGLVERANGLMKRATIDKGFYTLNRALEEDILTWNRTYNLYRKHSSLKRRTPLQEAQRWYILKPDLFTRDPVTLMN